MCARVGPRIFKTEGTNFRAIEPADVTTLINSRADFARNFIARLVIRIH